MPSFYWLKSLVSDALYFKAPVINRIETLDFVIEDKMLFMLSWEFAGKYKLMIPLLKKTYKARIGSVVIKIPSNTSYIYLKVSTWWRTSHYTFYLTRLKLDASTARQIIRELKPVKELYLKSNPVQPIIFPGTVFLPKPDYKGPDPAFKWKIEIHNDKLIYPHN